MKFILCLFLVFNLTIAIDISDLTSSQVLSLTGTASGKNFEFPVANVGDINGDNRDDLLIGGYCSQDDSLKESAYLIYGQSSFSSVEINFPSMTIGPNGRGIAIQGNKEEDGFGAAVSSAGDINKDGTPDFMVASPRKDGYKGEIYFIYGRSDLSDINLSADLDPASAGFKMTGDYWGSWLGASLSPAGKFNGDAYDDIVIGRPDKNAGNRGAAVVIYGGSSLSDIKCSGASSTLDPDISGFSIIGSAANDRFGTSVSNIGDINKDGYDDIIIGAPGKGSNQGMAYVIYGSQSPTNIKLETQTLDPTSTGFTITGNAAGDRFGCSVSSAGDINEDGIPDIIIGANGKDSNRGAAYIIYGRQSPVNIDLSDPSQALDPATTGFVVRGSAPGDYLGTSVQTVKDLNGDNLNEVIIGAKGQGSSSKGAVHVVYSGGSSHIDLSNKALDPATTGFTVTRDVTNGNFGFSVASGDFNDDGKPDLFVGSSGNLNPVNPGFVIDASKISADNCDQWDLPLTCQVCSANYEVVTPSLQCRACNIGNGEWYDSGNRECKGCLLNCAQCQDSSTCQSCSNGYGRRDNDKLCLACDNVSGKFLTSGGECKDCINNCDVCSAETTCDRCKADFGKWGSACVKCPTGTVLLAGICEPCIDGCDKCSDKESCEYCSNGFGLSGSVCVDPCPEKMYLSDDRICENCISNCDQCSKEKSCDYCSNGYGLLDSACINPCPVKMRLSDDRVCKSCISGCDQCSDNSTCDYCSSGFGQLGSVCVDSCPLKKYLSDDRVCEGCISDCDKCSNSETCDVCSNGSGLLNSVCVTCPIKMYLSDDGKCENCIPDCEKCSDNKSCLTCASGYGILDSRCVKCPTGMYLSEDGECLACGSNCNQCLDNTTCLTCLIGYGTLNSTCIKCPQDGMYFSNGTCSACSEGCSQCKDASACQVCAEDYMLSEWNLCIERKEESENVKSSSAFEGASLIGAAFSSGGSLPFNFGLVSKMVRNVKYLNISVSTELRQSFVSWTATSSFLKAPESWGSDSDTAESGSRILQEVFGRYGLEPAFLINYWKTLILTLVGVVIFGIFKVIEICFTKEDSKGRSVMRSIHIAASNFALTQFYSNLDDVVLYLAINGRSLKFEKSFNAISFIIGIVLLVIGVIALSIHILLLKKYQGLKKKEAGAELNTFKAKSQNVDLLFKDYKDTGFSTQSFLLVYLIRCIVASLIFALLFDYPFLQIFMLLLINASMITYLLVLRPFKSFFDTCGQFFSEFILLLVNICMLVLCLFDQAESKPLEAIDKLSRCVIVLNVILLVGCAVFLVISVLKLFYNLYKIYQDKKQTKNTSMVLSSLTQKLDKLKLNKDQKTSNFEQSNESQQNLHNVTDQPGLSLDKANSNSMLFENQAEDLMNTSHHGNLDLSGYFAEREKGAGIKPDDKKREKLSNSGILDYDEADIDPDGNQTENVIPLQNFKATFKQKKNKKAPIVEPIKENLSNSETLHQNEAEPSSSQLRNEDQTNPSEVNKLGIIQEESLSNVGVVNNDESADIDQSENQIENNVIPLQNFESTFKKKKNKKTPKTETIRENLSNPEPKSEAQIKSLETNETKEDNEDKNLSIVNYDKDVDIDLNGNQTKNNVIPLQNFESTFRKKN